MFSFNDGVEFLENKLKIERVEFKVKDDKLSLLREITRNFSKNIPFQNLKVLSGDRLKREVPSKEVIISEMKAGLGGICYTMGMFASYLLHSLGYNAWAVAGTIPRTGEKFTHVAAVVTGVEQSDDMYLVDIGCGFPTFEPIPLHSLPQKYHHAFLEYRFERKGSSIIRYHKVNDSLGPLPTEIDSEGYQIFYEIDPSVPQTEQSLHLHMEPLFTVPDYAGGWILMGLKMAIYPEGLAVTISDNCLRLWDAETNQPNAIDLQHGTDLENAIKEHFPTMESVDIQKGLHNLKMEKESAGRP